MENIGAGGCGSQAATKIKKKLVHGIGKNDAEYSIVRYCEKNGVKKRIWNCPFYRKWESMLNRCYSASYIKNKPTYMHCTVHEKWHYFSVFREWMSSQAWEKLCLDKDIISPGNKIYSPENCIFISSEMNSFTTDSGSIRGNFKIGASFHKRLRMFSSQCNDPFLGRMVHLGYFDSEYLAHEAWRSYKHFLSLKYAEMQTDHRIAEAMRKRYLPENLFKIGL